MEIKKYSLLVPNYEDLFWSSCENGREGGTRIIGRMEPTGIRIGVWGWSDLGHLTTWRRQGKLMGLTNEGHVSLDRSISWLLTLNEGLTNGNFVFEGSPLFNVQAIFSLKRLRIVGFINNQPSGLTSHVQIFLFFAWLMSSTRHVVSLIFPNWQLFKSAWFAFNFVFLASPSKCHGVVNCFSLKTWIFFFYEGRQ